ncbi:Arylsulfotransferase-domain-containing protein [Xylariaceae sp. FL0255]|nr:Arylsulfotransferase-domain-containing protein [Xylariaceae sp. FL0255]
MGNPFIFFSFFPGAASAVIVIIWSLIITFADADAPHSTNLDPYQGGDLGEIPKQTFFSSDIIAPIYQVNKFIPEKVDDTRFIFITGGYDDFGPSIISAKDLSLVWADQHFSEAQAHRTYTLYGQPVLGVFAGSAVLIYNENYDLLYRVTPQGDFSNVIPDSHEALITHDDTVVMIVSVGEEGDLSQIGGPENEAVTNNFIQEVNPANNKVIFQFDMRSYFNIEDSYWPYRGQGPFDFPWPHDLWHMNSVEKLPDGNFLVSSRHLHSIFLLDGKSAEVKWVLGGKRSHFRDVTENGSGIFRWQHNARLTAPNRITLFDNHDVFNGFCNDPAKGCSRGLEIEFDDKDMTFRVVNEWYHPQGLISASRGGVHRVPNGNTLIAWGQNPSYTEHAPDGEVVMDIQRGRVLPMDHGITNVITYRAWKSDWIGKPKYPPSIATHTDENSTTSVYVSWNGATEVDSYVLLGSNSTEELNGRDAIIAKSKRLGFETSFKLDKKIAYARIAALDTNGAILGFTSGVNTKSNKQLTLDYDLDDIITSKIEEEHKKKMEESRKGDAPAHLFGLIYLAAGFTAVFAITFAIRKPKPPTRLDVCGKRNSGRGTASDVVVGLYALTKLRVLTTIRNWRGHSNPQYHEEEEGLVEQEEGLIEQEEGKTGQ